MTGGGSRAGDDARGVGDEECDGLGDFPGASDAADRVRPLGVGAAQVLQQPALLLRAREAALRVQPWSSRAGSWVENLSPPTWSSRYWRVSTVWNIASRPRWIRRSE
ncbi:hypothetical protein [Saccharopolyspora sp. ASAGF58]|uniref:hypothetical protein n=1 Tax=Saccharopolyspora sp. ASAGF58 TaxID=2719023 RepID=UPI001B30AEDB|nr:hypothetical protein [Saccharopolyspora sp. ASAGF58]